MIVRNVKGHFKVPDGYESWLDWWPDKSTYKTHNTTITVKEVIRIVWLQRYSQYYFLSEIL